MVVTSKDSEKRIDRSLEMFALIQEWEGSQLSQKAFCSQRGLKPHIFWYWLRRYREKGQPLKVQTQGFVRVELEEAAEEAVLAEILYSDGTRLIFKERVGLAFLQSLLPVKA